MIESIIKADSLYEEIDDNLHYKQVLLDKIKKRSKGSTDYDLKPLWDEYFKVTESTLNDLLPKLQRYNTISFADTKKKRRQLNFRN